MTNSPDDPPPGKPQSAKPEPAYAVGYGRPPVHSRFKPGNSANPRGRPKKILEPQNALLVPFPVRIGGRTEWVPALDAMLMRVRALALKGDQKTLRYLLELFDSGTLTRSVLKRGGER